MFLTVNQNYHSRLHVNVVKTCACSTSEKILARTLRGKFLCHPVSRW
jgi:hypothetical protein